MLRKIRDYLRPALDELSWISPHVWMRGLLAMALLFGWSLLHEALPRGLFPSPTATLRALGRMIADPQKEMVIALGQTLSVYLTGLGLAAALGIALGILLGTARQIGRTTSPFLNALAATPIVALMPLIVLLLGLGWEAKVCIVTLAAVIPILINTQSGILQTSPELIEMGRACGLGPTGRLLQIRLPGALPSILAGVRLGAVMGLVAAAIADIYTAMTGLGALLQSYGNTFRMDAYFAVVALFMLIGVTTTGAITLNGRLLTASPQRDLSSS